MRAAAKVRGADGLARFTTIYPGWYQGRAVHIHVKIRTDPDRDDGFDFTSQVHFDDGLTDVVHRDAPYSANEGDRPRNPDDGIFRQGGDQLLLDVVREGAGYRAVFDIGLQID